MVEARDLVQLAGQLAWQGPALVASDSPVSEPRLYDYWIASKSRFDRWAVSLRQLGASRLPQIAWRIHLGTLEEILASELVSRVWTSILVAYDRRRGGDDAEPIARNVLAAHLELKNRLLARLVTTRRNRPPQVLAVNRLRLRCERLADMLVGQLFASGEVGEFACCHDRAAEFAATMLHDREAGLADNTWHLSVDPLQSVVCRTLSAVSPNADLNARVTAAILDTFDARTFDPLPLEPLLWRLRLAELTNRAEALVADLREGN